MDTRSAKAHKKNPNESFDINVEPIIKYSPLQNYTHLLSRYVCFAGWADIEADGKAEFTADSKCPPDNDGLGWRVVRDRNMPKRSNHSKLGDTFVGAIDERRTQTTFIQRSCRVVSLRHQ